MYLGPTDEFVCLELGLIIWARIFFQLPLTWSIAVGILDIVPKIIYTNHKPNPNPLTLISQTNYFGYDSRKKKHLVIRLGTRSRVFLRTQHYFMLSTTNCFLQVIHDLCCH